MGLWLHGSLVLVVSLLLVDARSEPEVIAGAGATFPLPLYREWLPRFQEDTGIRVTYQGLGSGAGIQQLAERRTDFGATDIYLSDSEMARLPGEILHLPTCVGAVAAIYHLPDVGNLKLTADNIADIYLGRITRWTDPRLAESNPGAAMPDLDIAVVHRSDASGTTAIFTSYLSGVCPAWQERVGSGMVVPWACGMGVERNEEVARFVKKIPGSIGYVELNYAEAQELSTALLRNRAGRFIKPSGKSVAAATQVALPPDLRIQLVDTAAADGYPICSFSYLIFYKEQAYEGRSLERARSLARFLWWTIHQGQGYTRRLSYVPLPEEAVKYAETILRSLQFAGNSIPGSR